MRVTWASVLGLNDNGDQHTVKDRANWSKFVCVCPRESRHSANCFGSGDRCKAINQSKGYEKGVTWLGEEVFLDLGSKRIKVDNECGECQGLHSTRSCEVYFVKERIKRYNRDVKRLRESLKASLLAFEQHGSSSVAISGGKKTKYVAPHNRGGARSPSDSGRHKSIKITNLSENITDHELKEIFRKFGRTEKVKLVRDRETGRSRGHAYIDFELHQDAQTAMDEMQNYAMGQQLLCIEWSQSRF